MSHWPYIYVTSVLCFTFSLKLALGPPWDYVRDSVTAVGGCGGELYKIRRKIVLWTPQSLICAVNAVTHSWWKSALISSHCEFGKKHSSGRGQDDFVVALHQQWRHSKYVSSSGKYKGHKERNLTLTIENGAQQVTQTFQVCLRTEKSSENECGSQWHTPPHWGHHPAVHWAVQGCAWERWDQKSCTMTTFPLIQISF